MRLSETAPAEPARPIAPSAAVISRRTRRTILGGSLTLHGGIVLWLLMSYPVPRLRSATTTYDVIVLPDVVVSPRAAEPESAERPAEAAGSPEPAVPVAAQPALVPAVPRIAQATPAAEVPREAVSVPDAPAVAQASRPTEVTPPLPEARPRAGLPAQPGASAQARLRSPQERKMAIIQPDVHGPTAPRATRRESGAADAARPLSVMPPRSATSVAPPVPAAGPDPVWLARVSQWLTAHQSYPEIARRRGEQGTVMVRFEADRSGQVLNASLARGSGLALLDEAALALLRGASLPPFPPDMLATRETVTIPVTYRLE